MEEDGLCSPSYNYYVIFLVAVGSLTLNVCFFTCICAQWMLKVFSRWRKKSYCETDSHHGATRITLIVQGIASVVGGLYILTSTTFWKSPFVQSDDSFAIPSTAASSQLSYFPTYRMDFSTAILSMALGRFVFALFHLIHDRFSSSSSIFPFEWSTARIVYLTVTVSTTAVVLATGENLFAGAAVILMEADAVVEELSQTVEVEGNGRWKKTERFLSISGCVASVAVRCVLLPTILVVLVRFGHAPLDMNPLSLGVFSFDCIFFEVHALLMIRLQMNRMRKKMTTTIRRDANYYVVEHHVSGDVESYSSLSLRWKPTGKRGRRVLTWMMKNSQLYGSRSNFFFFDRIFKKIFLNIESKDGKRISYVAPIDNV